MLSSLSESTLKQYECTYRLWWNYCRENGIATYEATVAEVISFLQNTFDKRNHRYGTLNSHRSALTLILDCDLGSNPLVKRLLKGFSRLRPSKPRYNSTWDPQRLLLFIESLGNPLSLRILSLKLVTLLALITGGRIQTLSLIRTSNIIESEDKIQIPITDPIKTSGPGRLQPTLHIPYFEENKLLCVATTLETYRQLTKPLRNPDSNFLFITTRKPYSTANKQTLSKWVREMLKMAGISTENFNPHSTRHCSTSAASRQGVSIETICRTAGWTTRSGTFAKYYNRPLTDTTTFAKSILSLSNSNNT